MQFLFTNKAEKWGRGASISSLIEKYKCSANKTSLHQNPTPGSVLLHLHVWDDRHPWTSCQCRRAGRLCQQEGAISSHYFIIHKKNIASIAEAALQKLPEIQV